MSGDEFSMTFPRMSLQDAVKGDRRTQLEGMRDYITRELEAHLCNTCQNSKLRTGDQASLLNQLRQVLNDLDSLPKDEEASGLDNIRFTIVGGSGRNGVSGAEDQPVSGKGAQRRSGSRRPRGNGRAVP